MFKKNSSKKIIILTLVFVIFFGVSNNVKSLTTADIELLINLGIIPSQNADSARNFLNQQTTISNNPGTILKIDPNSNKECLIINQNLVKGKSGSLVSALQRFLKSEGHFPKGQEITGFYGDTTVQAVVDFQLAKGLIKTSSEIGAGSIGPISRAKIEEVSCSKLQEKPQVDTTSTSTSTTTATTTSKFVEGLKNSNSKKNTIVTIKEPKVSLNYYQRYVDEEKGEMILRYDALATPKEIVSYLEGVVLCNPVAVNITSNLIKGCGEFFEVNPMKNGKKSFSVHFKNSTRANQRVVFAIEVFNQLKESLGIAQIDAQIPAKKPVVKLELNKQSLNQYGSVSLSSKQCSHAEQLDFIRYTMTPYDAERNDNISLPVCWPGELLCNRANPPTFCRIVDGPTSDDLCPPSQIFFKGECVPRE